MSPNEYQRLALRTENTPDLFLPDAFPKTDHPHGLASRRARLLHGMIGVCTEAGELQDAIKREMFYRKPLDEMNIVEECGDLLWYIALTLESVGANMEDAMEKNIAKLRARYPEKFTNEKALERDLDAERRVLEDG